MTVRFASVRILLAVAALHDWELFNVDIKAAYLAADLDTVLDGWLKSYGFVSATFDECVYTMETDRGRMILGVFVDDIIAASSSIDPHRLDSRSHPGPWAKVRCRREDDAYLGSTCRPDIAQATYRCATSMSKPTRSTWTSAVRVLTYLLRTRDIGITYGRGVDGANRRSLGTCSSSTAAQWRGRRRSSPRPAYRQRKPRPADEAA